MPKTTGYAATSPTSPLSLFKFERREPGPADVEIDIMYCGICHSDIHTVRSEWAGTQYPCVPGHEIVGRVTRVGKSSQEIQGRRSRRRRLHGRSCRTCPKSCKKGLEQYCEAGAI